MKRLTLHKKQKLCSELAVEKLFAGGGAEFSRLHYPLRAVGRNNPGRSSDAPVAFLISVPKKRLRHAVDRVLMRRRIREAFRLNHRNYEIPSGSRIDLAFIYVADGVVSYAKAERAVCRILQALSEHYSTAAALADESVTD